MGWVTCCCEGETVCGGLKVAGDGFITDFMTPGDPFYNPLDKHMLLSPMTRPNAIHDYADPDFPVRTFLMREINHQTTY
jgi:hypothetical protein